MDREALYAEHFSDTAFAPHQNFHTIHPTQLNSEVNGVDVKMISSTAADLDRAKQDLSREYELNKNMQMKSSHNASGRGSSKSSKSNQVSNKSQKPKVKSTSKKNSKTSKPKPKTSRKSNKSPKKKPQRNKKNSKSTKTNKKTKKKSKQAPKGRNKNIKKHI